MSAFRSHIHNCLIINKINKEHKLYQFIKFAIHPPTALQKRLYYTLIWTISPLEKDQITMQ